MENKVAPAAFVPQDSIVRRIWGIADTVLLIFAGASAEFALHRSVDWLYFTGRLPADPLKRLFSTIAYAHQIVFSNYDTAIHAIDQISGIHAAVEQQRGKSIPDWAYRDVLYLLIDYSIRAHELLEAPLTRPDTEDLYQVFYGIGTRMHIPDLPVNYQSWVTERKKALRAHLVNSHFTQDLYCQYRKHLGAFRFRILVAVQPLVVPEPVTALLGSKQSGFARLLLSGYKTIRRTRMGALLKNLLLPRQYKDQINALNVTQTTTTPQ